MEYNKQKDYCTREPINENSNSASNEYMLDSLHFKVMEESKKKKKVEGNL